MYVFHSEAGVFGKGRFEDMPGVDQYRHVLRLLPPDLPNWERNDGKGERAVFFLAPAGGGEFQPHLRGQGILKLDKDDRVADSSLTLAEIRRLAASAGAK